MPVRHHAVLYLFKPNLVAQIEVDAAFEIVHRVAKLPHALLQRGTLVARELRVTRRPRCAHAGAPLCTISDLRCGEREHIGNVVALDDLEVLANEEGRTACATR